MSTEAQALAAAHAASAEVGSGAIDTVVAGCDLIRFGVFFDGTFNFRDKAGDPQRPWHTNVDLLEGEYMVTDGSAEVETINGQPRKVRYMKRYFRGIGVKSDGTLQDGMGVRALDSVPFDLSNPLAVEVGRQAIQRSRTVGLGGGLGIGPEGVLARVNEACDEILERLRTQTGDVTPCEIWFDTFGFSRGAAAARFFTNRVKRGEISYNGARNTTQFLGLFDTVASISNLDPATGFQSTPEPSDPYAQPSDPYAQLMASHVPAPEFDPNVDIRTSGNGALAIVHITARDEMRRNFPLSASTGKTIAMLGAHADIGGGYRPGRSTSSYSFDSRSEWQVLEFFNRRWNEGEDGNILHRTSAASAADHALGHNPQRFIINVTAEFGLQMAALHVMHHEAIRRGVPFPERLPSAIKGQSVPSDLMAYLSALISGSRVDDAEERRIRSKYANWSARNVMGMGPERTAQRRVFMV